MDKMKAFAVKVWYINLKLEQGRDVINPISAKNYQSVVIYQELLWLFRPSAQSDKVLNGFGMR
jgi:hypothetical protein